MICSIYTLLQLLKYLNVLFSSEIIGEKPVKPSVSMLNVKENILLYKCLFSLFSVVQFYMISRLCLMKVYICVFHIYFKKNSTCLCNLGSNSVTFASMVIVNSSVLIKMYGEQQQRSSKEAESLDCVCCLFLFLSSVYRRMAKPCLVLFTKMQVRTKNMVMAIQLGHHLHLHTET